MNALFRLIAFAALLAAVFGAAALAGAAIDPDRGSPAAPAHAGAMAMEHDAGGLALTLDRTGRRLTFRVVDEDGATVRDFEVEHTKRMHLIVVRHDLTGFQHLHPVQADDGSWSVPLRLPAAGTYRVFADFTRGGERQVLESNVSVSGRARLHPLPPPSSSDTVDGYEVRLDDSLNFSVTRGGRPVATEPYLGAAGHLVALREGDLEFLHVHPEGDGFDAEFPTPGRYRLFLQFKHDGRVHTAAFTKAVS